MKNRMMCHARLIIVVFTVLCFAVSYVVAAVLFGGNREVAQTFAAVTALSAGGIGGMLVMVRWSDLPAGTKKREQKRKKRTAAVYS